MDDLIVAAFERSFTKYASLHESALSSHHPLRALQSLERNFSDRKRMIEFVALAKVYPGLRSEMRVMGENIRRMQIEALEKAYSKQGGKSLSIHPVGLALLISAAARDSAIEREIGIDLGHSEVEVLIEELLDQFEPVSEVGGNRGSFPGD
jgi:hypothetical protein